MIKNLKITDEEILQDEIGRLNSAVNYVEDILYEGSHSIDEAVLIASKRYDVLPANIWNSLR